MIPATCFGEQTIAVFGLGSSGLATVAALIAGGAKVTVADDNPDRLAEAVDLGAAPADFRETGLSGCAALVLAPGVPLTDPEPHWVVKLAKQAAIPIIGDIELFARERRRLAPNSTLIAITGTNGKSTTTALIAHVLTQIGMKVAMGGNIGEPVLALAPPQENSVYVVECSSYQIELAPGIDPDIGILLNLSPDHLDRHGTMNHYAAIKERLLAQSRHRIVGTSDHWCRAIAGRLETEPGKSTGGLFRLDADKNQTGIAAYGTQLSETDGGRFKELCDLRDADHLRGAHNGQNASAAAAAWLLLTEGEGDKSDLKRAFDTFPGLEHRMQIVGRRDHVLFVNDSKATNADAAAAALSSFERIYWIAGGLAKEGGIQSLREYFPGIAKAYLIGEAAPEFASVLGSTTKFVISKTLERAVAQAAADAAKDQHDEPVVLLSPACASFDQFANFEVRGRAYSALVAGLPQPDGQTAARECC